MLLSTITAAIAPSAAAVTTCLRLFTRTSPAAYTPGIFVCMSASVGIYPLSSISTLPLKMSELGIVPITGKKTNPAENFNIKTSDVAGKNIILIDDVITRGMTYMHTTNKLINNGANMVKGLFLAKTINPDWVRHSA